MTVWKLTLGYLEERSRVMCVRASPHAVESRHCVGAVFTLDDGFPVQRVPVIKLSVELDGDDVQVAGIMVPGEIAVHTDHIHVGSLGK